MKRILAISHAYVEPFTRVGLVDANECKDIQLTVVIPKFMAKKYPLGYKKLVEENYVVKTLSTIFNFHHSVRAYLFGLIFLIIKIKPHVIFINNEPWSMTAFQTVLISRIFCPTAKILIYTCENLVRKYPLPFRWFERFVLKNIDLILTLSSWDGEYVLRKKGYKGRIVYHPLSVDVKLFKKQYVIDFKKSISSNAKFVVGYVGRLVKEKGVDLLINAVKKLNFDYHVLIIGDGPEKPNLVKLVEKNNLTNKVSFLNNIFYPELPKYVNCLDILVLPSRTTSNWKEQFGRVLIEAMACEVAVIGSSSGEIPYVVGEAGLIFKEDDCSDLAQKIEILLTNEQLRKQLGEKGRERVVANFSREKINSELIRLYQELL